jgi:hypothetical protein
VACCKIPTLWWLFQEYLWYWEKEDQRVPSGVCYYNKIKDTYPEPDGDYVGFKKAKKEDE